MDINICLVNNITGSCIMKKKLFKCNNNFNYYYYHQIPIKKNAIYIFIKHITKDIKKKLILLKKKSNYLIYEPLDTFWDCNDTSEYKLRIKEYIKYFDCILCNNNYITKISKTIFPDKKFIINYHEYDIKYNCNNLNVQNNIYYIGTLKKQSLHKNIINKYNIKIINSNFIENINNNYIGIHIDFILDNKFYYYLHTSTKLGTCLINNSIFICNRIPIYLELLGNEYEFYINDDLSNLDIIIDKAKNTIKNKTKYISYLKKMKYIKDKLSPENCYNNYITLFNKIYENKIKKNK